MYANLISLDPAKEDQTETRSCRNKGKCTHRCDIHKVECCDDNPKNSTENSSDMADLTGAGSVSILSLRNLVDPGAKQNLHWEPMEMT